MQVFFCVPSTLKKIKFLFSAWRVLVQGQDYIECPIARLPTIQSIPTSPTSSPPYLVSQSRSRLTQIYIRRKPNPNFHYTPTLNYNTNALLSGHYYDLLWMAARWLITVWCSDLYIWLWLSRFYTGGRISLLKVNRFYLHLNQKWCEVTPEFKI